MEFLEVPLFDDDLAKMLVRLTINLLASSILIWGCYRRNQPEGNPNVFTFVLLNLSVFFVCFTLKKMELELGMALGLFAIFSIIRYRTDTVPIKEMTYLFVVVGIAVINSLSNKNTSYAELFFANVAILFAAWILEKVVRIEKKIKLQKQPIVIDRLELLPPDRRTELTEFLEQMTGLKIEKIAVDKIDLTKKSACLTIFY